MLVAAAPWAVLAAAPDARGASPSTTNPLADDGMWIWYVSDTGGTAAAIARQARRYHVETVLIKSSDGSTAWSQFSPALVAGLHARGLRVCAWQFVYGLRPLAEAFRGAEAVTKGADCLVIDAESTYEGRYKAADAYVRRLRGLIGRSYPLALASFPYVDYHPGLPYSVFLGRRGAQFNVPQMYWRAIGTPVRVAFAHTYLWNRIYDRPIYPLGQTYQNPSPAEIASFRQHARAYRARGVSWWAWHVTDTQEWGWLSRELSDDLGWITVERGYVDIGRGYAGDPVVLIQELLRAWDRLVPVTGRFGARTERAVRAFQRQRGLAPTGVVNDPTWRRLLLRRPVWVSWDHVLRAPRGARSAANAANLRAPLSADLPSVVEIPSTPGIP